MMRGFPIWVVANLKMFFRDRVTMFWAIVFPILLMGLLGLAFGRAQGIDVRVGVVNQDAVNGTASFWSVQLWSTLDKTHPPFEVANYTDVDAAKAKVESGELDVVVVIPPGFGAWLQSQIPPSANATNFTVPVYVGRSEQGTGAIGAQTLQQLLDRFYEAVTGSAHKLRIDEQAPLTQQSFQYIDFLAPGIIAMSVMQNGVFGLSLFIVSAREKRILKRLQATPAGASYILAGRIVPAILVSFVQTGVLLSIAIFGFGVHITGNPGVLAISIAFGALVFITLGFLISSVSKTVDSAESLTNVITLPMFFLGGVFIPLDRLPQSIQYVGAAMPLTYFSDALRNIMLHGAGFGAVGTDVLVLTGFAVVIFVTAVKLFRWE